jgi:hypothetical protein
VRTIPVFASLRPGFSHGFPGFRFEHGGRKGYHFVAVPGARISLSFGQRPGRGCGHDGSGRGRESKNDSAMRDAAVPILALPDEALFN